MIRTKAFLKLIEELQTEQTQIFEPLRTEFSCVMVGYVSKESNHSYYPHIVGKVEYEDKAILIEKTYFQAKEDIR